MVSPFLWSRWGHLDPDGLNRTTTYRYTNYISGASNTDILFVVPIFEMQMLRSAITLTG